MDRRQLLFHVEQELATESITIEPNLAHSGNW
jgi:hypothetical protein